MTAHRPRKSSPRAAGKSRPRTTSLGLAGFDDFCRSLPHTTFVKQWGDAHVWKIGGKVFVLAREDEEGFRASFKCSDLGFEVLRDQPGLQPAPYLASRGLKWIQRFGPETLDDEAFLAQVSESYRLVASGLPKKRQAELGLLPAPVASNSGATRSRTRRKQ